MKQFIAIVLLLPLAGCFADRESQWLPSDIAPMFGGGGGGSAPAPARPAPGYNGQPLAPGTSKMLQDPEASESSTEDYVWAEDEQSARNACQRTAERNGWRLDDVKLDWEWTNNAGKKRFTCSWTIFGDPKP